MNRSGHCSLPTLACDHASARFDARSCAQHNLYGSTEAKNMRKARLLLAIALFAFFSVSLWAQKITGSIIGVVTDPSGAVVANVPVTITSPATSLTRSVTTNDSGEYSALDLPFGMYRIVVKQPGYKEFVVNNVDLHVASTSTVNVTLQLGSATDSVTVEANVIQVQTDSAQLGEVVDGTQVRELPLNGRNFVQLTQLQPGVSAARS